MRELVTETWALTQLAYSNLEGWVQVLETVTHEQPGVDGTERRVMSAQVQSPRSVRPPEL